ncbi:hypothetical protein FM120_31515 [Sphingobacterium faecium PCAi_F2.5]|nr:hypothetical protein FM120_31515 [Sphingobacterium faecium PCAi_F2.5]
MAVSILKQPEDICWSRNPILYEFHTDKVIEDFGRPVIFSIDFSNVENVSFYPPPPDLREWLIYADFGFKLSVGSLDLNFTCSDGTTAGNFMIPHRIAEPEELKSNWMIRVRDAIVSVFNIDSIFKINIDGDKLIFTSKNNDESLVIALDNFDIYHKVILSVNQTATTRVFTPNLKIYCALFSVDQYGEENSLISAALAPDLNGKAQWDFSKPLTSECLSFGSDLPSLYEVVFEKGKVVREFFVKITELYGEPQEANLSIKSSRKRVIYGGLPKNLQNTSLTESLSQYGVVRFLKTSFENIKVNPDQPNWVSWFNISEDRESVQVQVELLYNDGTPYIFTAHTYETVLKYEKLIFPVGLDQLGANDLYPELSIVSYKVSLKSDGVVLSNVLNFEVDQRHHLYTRYFLFQNSLGAFESFYTYGRKSNSYDIEKEKTRISQVQDFVLEIGEDQDFDIQLLEKEEINTGWKSKAEIRSMRDFFMSSVKLTMIDGKWWPISVNSSSIKEFEDGNGLYALAFEISMQHTQELFFDN